MNENRGIFIQANNKQILGAKIAKFAMETRGGAARAGIPVAIMNVEEDAQYMTYAGTQYQRGGEKRVHDPNDLQFFTLSRFMPPKLMAYSGRALVIDPDIFALSDITGLFDLDLKDCTLAACSKKDAWDSSVMVLACDRLKHWDVYKLLENLKTGTADYREWMQLRREKVNEIPRIWNSLDVLTQDTKMLHTTERLTQPWKTGLPIDFTPGKPPKLFGIIPREPILKLRGKWPTHYKPHSDRSIEKLFFDLARESLAAGAVTETEVKNGIAKKDLRPDFLEKVTSL